MFTNTTIVLSNIVYLTRGTVINLLHCLPFPIFDNDGSKPGFYILLIVKKIV